MRDSVFVTTECSPLDDSEEFEILGVCTGGAVLAGERLYRYVRDKHPDDDFMFTDLSRFEMHQKYVTSGDYESLAPGLWHVSSDLRTFVSRDKVYDIEEWDGLAKLGEGYMA